MEQLDRITRMERILDEASEVLGELSRVVERYDAVRKKLRELAEYYSSAQWRQDYADDSAGKLPAELKRGVLSQDAVYDLLEDHSRLMERLEALVERERAKPL